MSKLWKPGPKLWKPGPKLWKPRHWAAALLLTAAVAFVGATPANAADDDYRQVHLHFSSNFCDDSTGQFGDYRSHGYCGGVFTDGHIAPFDGRLPGVVTWSQYNPIRIHDQSGHSALDGYIPDRGSAAFTIDTAYLSGVKYAVQAPLPGKGPGEKDGPLNLRVTEDGSIFALHYNFYVDGWLRVTPRPPQSPMGAVVDWLSDAFAS